MKRVYKGQCHQPYTLISNTKRVTGDFQKKLGSGTVIMYFPFDVLRNESGIFTALDIGVNAE
jgi:hypothetical protein